MQMLNTCGIICVKDKCNILYKLSKIDYNEYENGEYEYIFTPNYNVIDLLDSNVFQGIPGLDLSLKRERYIRKNMVPVFVSERTPSENREDVRELLEENGMDVLNRLEWLIRTNTKYSGDNLFVIPFKDNEIKIYKEKSIYDLVKRSDNINKKLLSIICSGDYLYADNLKIDDSNRNMYYHLLISIYEYEYSLRKESQREGIEKAKQNNVYKGRKKIRIDPFKFDEISKKYINKEITIDEVLSQLKISKATFFRRLKENKT